MRRPADRRRLEGETEVEFGVSRAQHGKRRRHDLRTDAVAFQHQQIDCIFCTLLVHGYANSPLAGGVSITSREFGSAFPAGPAPLGLWYRMA